MKIVFEKVITEVVKSKVIRFSFFTYLAIVINVLSGVFLARSMGASQRGLLAYYANFLLLSSFVSASNISNATARTLVDFEHKVELHFRQSKSVFFYVGFLMAAATTCVISGLIINDWEVNKNFFIILMLVNALGAVTSLYDGYWRFNNSISFLTATRFIGLAAPSFFTFILISMDNVEIRYLLLGQLVVIILNLWIIFLFIKRCSRPQFPESRKILKSAFHGFPTYLAEYLVAWIVPFFILRVEGSEVLGWYIVALSYSLLADVTYSALEAKNYKFMSAFSKHKETPKLGLFLKNSSPVLGMHLFFISFAFMIPIIYGEEFGDSSLFAIAILIIRVPIVISRSITSYLISTSKNIEPLIIFLSFLITFTTVMSFSNVKLLSFYWIFAYATGAIVMLLTALLILFKVSSKIRHFGHA